MSRAEHILTDHKLRITQSRRAVLDSFLSADQALSQPDLEKLMEHTCDRVTIYRILDSFMQSGILHRVPDTEGGQKYALCDSCSEHHHHDEHLHFKCRVCGKTECLDQVIMPELHLPEGYQLEEWTLLLQGTCPQCSGE